ncbi:hypothetical protein [Maricaulis sp.]|uniref:hypothetical protein n=1 Tax=Maricaulis sp. TaxID=1486257 RepID=UPI001B03C797|nr:hypothetical protein [Maricaulis sp.]MBO6765892.1 hypothetical protein [Maricaulis sp.]
MLFARLSKISATLFVSMLMAMGMLVLLWFYLPEWLGWVQDGADLVEDGVSAIPIPEQYNNLVRIYASDDKIVLLIFTVIARFILAIFGTAFTAATRVAKVRVAEPPFISRISSMIATLFLSFVVAILMLAFIALTMEHVLHSMLDMADWVEDQLAHLPLAGRWRSGVRFAVSDDKILLLFFTIIARVLIALVATAFTAAWNSVTGGKTETIKVPA